VPQELRERFAELAERVGAADNLPLEQWHRLYERAVAAAPDMIIEVGRGYGNSTVVLTEAAHELGVRVYSVGNDVPPTFANITWGKLRPVVGEAWRSPLILIQGDVRNYKPFECERAFLFWDAHGPEVAETMLKRLIPALPRGSTVVVHDVCTPQEAAEYPVEADPARGLPNGYPYSWNGFVSPFEELPLLGAWLDERGIEPEHDTWMLAFSL
jgi:hypothetical protein